MVHVNGSCHVSRSHVTESCPRVMNQVLSHVNDSCQIRLSHVSYECITSHMSVSCHTWMSHVLRMKESCFNMNESRHGCHVASAWAMSVTNASRHIWVCHVTYGWVISRIWKSRVSVMNESCHAYERVMFQLWMSHVTHAMSHLDEPCQLQTNHARYE